MRMFIFGAGYAGQAIARLAKDHGAWVGGTTRSEDKVAQLAAGGIDPFLFDGRLLSPAIIAALTDVTEMVVSIAPDHGMRAVDGDTIATSGDASSADPLLGLLADRLPSAAPALRWVGYLSTVGVYGGHDGAWIGENADCRPSTRRSRMRLDAERQWLTWGRRHSLPVAILRLSGIYGPGRNALLNIESGTAKRIIKPDQVFNRIHVDDIAHATMHLADHRLGGVFNVTDDEPAPPQDVVEFAARLMGVAPPPPVSFDEAEMTPMARSFYGENKRVSNAKLKRSGYRLLYPDYRAALTDLWQRKDWRGRKGR